MLPTRKFNELPVATGIVDSSKLFCIVDGVDSLITIGTLRELLGISSNGSEIDTSDTYVDLFSLDYGSEYYDAPYIYKRIATGAVRISTDTTFDIPTGSSVSSGFVRGTYASLLTSATTFEYHELPYVYKKYPFGVLRISVDTTFNIPSGTGIANGIVVDTYANMLTSSLGYEYHEMPYIYKKTYFGPVRLNPDTEFPSP